MPQGMKPAGQLRSSERSPHRHVKTAAILPTVLAGENIASQNYPLELMLFQRRERRLIQRNGSFLVILRGPVGLRCHLQKGFFKVDIRPNEVRELARPESRIDRDGFDSAKLHTVMEKPLV